MWSLPFHEEWFSRVSMCGLKNWPHMMLLLQLKATVNIRDVGDVSSSGKLSMRASALCTSHLRGSWKHLVCRKQSLFHRVKNAHDKKQSSLFKNKEHEFVGKIKFFGSTFQAVFKNMSE